MIDLVIRRRPGRHWVRVRIGRGMEPGRGEGEIYRLGIDWRRAWAAGLGRGCPPAAARGRVHVRAARQASASAASNPGILLAGCNGQQANVGRVWNTSLTSGPCGRSTRTASGSLKGCGLCATAAAGVLNHPVLVDTTNAVAIVAQG